MFFDRFENLFRFFGVQPIEKVGHCLEARIALSRRVAHALQTPVQNVRYLLRHLRRELPHLGESLDGGNFVILAQIVEHHRCALRIEVRQHQGDRLWMFGIEQLAQLLRVGALQLGQVAVSLLLRAAYQHQQIIGPFLAKGPDQQAAGIIEPAMDHEVLRLEQFPELLEDLRREFRRDPAQIGQLLGQPLHVRFRQSAQNLLRELLAYGHQQDRGLARAAQRRCRPTLRFVDFDSLLRQDSVPFDSDAPRPSVPCSFNPRIRVLLVRSSNPWTETSALQSE